MGRVLVAEDDEGVRSFLVEVLELAGHEVFSVEDGAEALGFLRRQSAEVLLTDLKMPKIDGLTLLKTVRAEMPELQVVLLTAHGTVENAVEAMKAGACDYLQKPIGSPSELRIVIERALERGSLLNLRERTEREQQELRLTWGAPAMSSVESALRKVSKTEATVLLQGESGTGKEVAAQAIHRWSHRSAGPFVAVNGAALSKELLESELFGHEKGAFTGAHVQRRGRLELAAGGTFFLDEIGELEASLQAKLLRVLQERTFERVGGRQTLRAEVRWIAATNRDLREEVAKGRFREDLYHRLAVFPIRLPPLRERREDVVPLAEVLLRSIALELKRPALRFSPAAAALLTRMEWPGNVRELRNTLERAAILCDEDTLEEEHLWLDLPVFSRTQSTANDGTSLKTLEAHEQELIERTLASVGGNRKKAAEALGIGLRTLYDKLKRYGVSGGGGG